MTDGLSAGQEVVLADLAADLPTGDTQSERLGGGFGESGFSGGQLPPGQGPPTR